MILHVIKAGKHQSKVLRKRRKVLEVCLGSLGELLPSGPQRSGPEYLAHDHTSDLSPPFLLFAVSAPNNFPGTRNPHRIAQ